MEGIGALDTISRSTRKRRQAEMSKTFKFYALVTVIIEYFIIGISIAYISVFQETLFVWTQILHFPTLIRAVLLSLVILFVRVDVYRILGVNKYYKILRHFTYHPLLAWWLFLGFASLYLLYWWIPIANVLHFVLSDIPTTTQFPLYISLDILFFIEHWLSVYLVYKKGVVENVMNHSPELQYQRRSDKGRKKKDSKRRIKPKV